MKTLRKLHPATYGSFRNMRKRCNYPYAQDFARYGGRGITVCERWTKFEHFLADMGERPDGMSLDRVNSKGNYEPGNCRWATIKVQIANRTCAHQVELDTGEVVPLKVYAKRHGLSYQTLLYRFKHKLPLLEKQKRGRPMKVRV